MKFFDAGQEAHGFIAIGQIATGFFALGQGATGVIAIGQLARGVIAIGQVAIGVVTVGQLGFGLAGCAAMLGVAGRWAKGIVLPLFPPVKPEPETEIPPRTVPFEDVRDGKQPDGWIEADLEVHGPGVAVMYEGRPLHVEIDEKVMTQARKRSRERWTRTLVHLRREERVERDAQRGYREAAPSEVVLVCEHLRPVPEPAWRSPGFWLKTVARTVGLIVLLGVYTFVAAGPILEGLLTIPE